MQGMRVQQQRHAEEQWQQQRKPGTSLCMKLSENDVYINIGIIEVARVTSAGRGSPHEAILHLR